ncbi:MAG: hypothetical protein JXM70_25255 [Pirellulales bacterium]|nr:hypothetical protein [Pirellulales bacterium]
MSQVVLAQSVGVDSIMAGHEVIEIFGSSRNLAGKNDVNLPSARGFSGMG